MAIATINPSTGETVKAFDEMSEADVERCLAAAAAAYASYRLTSFAERAGWMGEAAGILDGEQDQIAFMMTTEMGKTLAAARQEVAKCAAACRYYAEHAPGFLADEPADAGAVGAESAYVSYQPLGPVLAIMPWNFPLWQAMRFAAPALMAGNVGLLKHASNVPQTALFIPDLFARAGFPEGTFQTLLVGSARVEAILRDPRVAAATLTGSGPAGSSVAAIAGSEIKKVVLELGGSDPFVVMPSADLPRAAQVAAVARCLNNGQSCIAAKRFIVHDAVYDEFERLFTGQMSAKAVGDPMAESTDVGPLASEQQRDDVEHLVADAAAKGAKVLCGGAAPEGRGFYYPPTVLSRHHSGHARAPRGGLRAGCHPVPRPGHRRGDRARQRHGVRPGRQRVDQRPGRTGPVHPRPGRWDGVHQRQRDLISGTAVRRSQEVRARPGAFLPRHPRVLQHQVGLGRRPRSPGLAVLDRGGGRPGQSLGQAGKAGDEAVQAG